jgi:hypothetical protein
MDDDTVALADLVPLVRQLRAGGYRVIGPTVRDGAIVLAELESADDLPYGWGVETSPGRYRLRRRVDRAAFGHAAGPQAWKRFLHPPREPVLSASRHGGRLAFDSPDEPAERYAFLGVRPCDLRAITVQDRVLGARGSRAEGRRTPNMALFRREVLDLNPRDAAQLRSPTGCPEHKVTAVSRGPA